MSYYASRLGVVPIIIPELGRDLALWNDLKALWKIYRLFRQEKPGIIHTHTAKAGGLGRVAGLLYNAGRVLTRNGTRAKLVHSFHGHVFHGYFPPWKSRLLVLTERFLALLTDKIIAVSEGIKSELVNVYRICPAEKIVVIPLGLDFGWVGEMGNYRGSLRREFGIPADAITIGIVGRLTAIKNHGLFLAATCDLQRDDWRFLIIGDGELRDEIARMTCAMRLDARVIIAGWQRETAKIYTDLDIVCLTSRNEGTPVALIEAMAAGRPFVSTKVGGVLDLMVGEGTTHAGGFEVFANGILVPPDDPPALAAALRYLADRPDLRRIMGSVGQAAVLKRFSKDRMLQEMETIYTALLERTNGRA